MVSGSVACKCPVREVPRQKSLVVFLCFFNGRGVRNPLGGWTELIFQVAGRGGVCGRWCGGV